MAKNLLVLICITMTRLHLSYGQTTCTTNLETACEQPAGTGPLGSIQRVGIGAYSTTFHDFICYTFDPMSKFNGTNLAGIDSVCRSRCSLFGINGLYGRSAMFRSVWAYNFTKLEIAKKVKDPNLRIIFGAAAYGDVGCMDGFSWSAGGQPSPATISDESLLVTRVATNASTLALAMAPSEEFQFYAYDLNNLYGLPFLCECSCSDWQKPNSSRGFWNAANLGPYVSTSAVTCTLSTTTTSMMTSTSSSTASPSTGTTSPAGTTSSGAATSTASISTAFSALPSTTGPALSSATSSSPSSSVTVTIGPAPISTLGSTSTIPSTPTASATSGTSASSSTINAATSGSTPLGITSVSSAAPTSSTGISSTVPVPSAGSSSSSITASTISTTPSSVSARVTGSLLPICNDTALSDSCLSGAYLANLIRFGWNSPTDGFICYTYDNLTPFTGFTLSDVDENCLQRCGQLDLPGVYGRSAMFRSPGSYDNALTELTAAGCSTDFIIFGAAGNSNASSLKECTWSSNGAPSTATITQQSFPVTIIAGTATALVLAFTPQNPYHFYGYDLTYIYGRPYLCECTCRNWQNPSSTVYKWDADLSTITSAVSTSTMSTVASTVSSTTAATSSSPSTSSVTSTSTTASSSGATSMATTSIIGSSSVSSSSTLSASVVSTGSSTPSSTISSSSVPISATISIPIGITSSEPISITRTATTTTEPITTSFSPSTSSTSPTSLVFVSGTSSASSSIDHSTNSTPSESSTTSASGFIVSSTSSSTSTMSATITTTSTYAKVTTTFGTSPVAAAQPSTIATTEVEVTASDDSKSSSRRTTTSAGITTQATTDQSRPTTSQSASASSTTSPGSIMSTSTSNYLSASTPSSTKMYSGPMSSSTLASTVPTSTADGSTSLLSSAPTSTAQSSSDGVSTEGVQSSSLPSAMTSQVHTETETVVSGTSTAAQTPAPMFNTLPAASTVEPSARTTMDAKLEITTTGYLSSSQGVTVSTVDTQDITTSDNMISSGVSREQSTIFTGTALLSSSAVRDLSSTTGVSETAFILTTDFVDGSTEQVSSAELSGSTEESEASERTTMPQPTSLNVQSTPTSTVEQVIIVAETQTMAESTYYAPASLTPSTPALATSSSAILSTANHMSSTAAESETDQETIAGFTTPEYPTEGESATPIEAKSEPSTARLPSPTTLLHSETANAASASTTGGMASDNSSRSTTSSKAESSAASTSSATTISSIFTAEGSSSSTEPGTSPATTEGPVQTLTHTTDSLPSSPANFKLDTSAHTGSTVRDHELTSAEASGMISSTAKVGSTPAPAARNASLIGLPTMVRRRSSYSAISTTITGHASTSVSPYEVPRVDSSTSKREATTVTGEETDSGHTTAASMDLGHVTPSGTPAPSSTLIGREAMSQLTSSGTAPFSQPRSATGGPVNTTVPSQYDFGSSMADVTDTTAPGRSMTTLKGPIDSKATTDSTATSASSLAVTHDVPRILPSGSTDDSKDHTTLHVSSALIIDKSESSSVATSKQMSHPSTGTSAYANLDGAPSSENPDMSLPALSSGSTSGGTSSPNGASVSTDLSGGRLNPSPASVFTGALSVQPDKLNTQSVPADKLSTSSAQDGRINTLSEQHDKLSILSVQADNANTLSVDADKPKTLSAQVDTLNTLSLRDDKFSTSTVRGGKHTSLSKQADKLSADTATVSGIQKLSVSESHNIQTIRTDIPSPQPNIEPAPTEKTMNVPSETPSFVSHPAMPSTPRSVPDSKATDNPIVVPIASASFRPDSLRSETPVGPYRIPENVTPWKISEVNAVTNTQGRDKLSAGPNLAVPSGTAKATSPEHAPDSKASSPVQDAPTDMPDLSPNLNSDSLSVKASSASSIRQPDNSMANAAAGSPDNDKPSPLDITMATDKPIDDSGVSVAPLSALDLRSPPQAPQTDLVFAGPNLGKVLITDNDKNASPKASSITDGTDNPVFTIVPIFASSARRARPANASSPSISEASQDGKTNTAVTATSIPSARTGRGPAPSDRTMSVPNLTLGFLSDSVIPNMPRITAPSVSSAGSPISTDSSSSAPPGSSQRGSTLDAQSVANSIGTGMSVSPGPQAHTSGNQVSPPAGSASQGNIQDPMTRGQQPAEEQKAAKSRPKDPMTSIERTATDIMHSLGCVWVIGCSSACFLLGAVTSCRSPDRQLLASQELSLIASHLLIFLWHDATSNEQLCTAVAVLIHYFSVVYYSFLLLESVRSFFVLVAFVSRPGLKPIAYAQLAGWGVPCLIVATSTALYHQDYDSTFSCWLNIEHSVSSFTLMPVILLSSTALIFAEATGTQQPCQPITSQEMQRSNISSQVSRHGLLLILPLSLASWAMGFSAVFYQRMEAYVVVCGINIALGVAVLFFHVGQNAQVRQLLHQLYMKVKQRFR